MAEQEEEGISIYGMVTKIKSTWKYLWSKWLIIVFVGLSGGATGVILSYLNRPDYMSHLTFVVEENSSSSSSGLASIASSFGLGASPSEAGLFSSTNLLEFLKSRYMVEKTLLERADQGKKTYAELYIESQSLRETWEGVPGLKKIRFLPNEDRSKFSLQKDSILGFLYEEVTTKCLQVSIPNDENMFIAIDVKSKNEKFSKGFSEKLLDLASEYYIETKTKKAKLNVDILQRQVDSVRRELFSAIAGVAASNDQVFGLNPAMNVARVPSAKKQVDVQANSAILTELVKNLELSKMSLLNETPVIQVIDRPILPLEMEELSLIEGIGWGGIAGGFIIVFVLLGYNYVITAIRKGKQQEELVLLANDTEQSPDKEINTSKE